MRHNGGRLLDVFRSVRGGVGHVRLLGTAMLESLLEIIAANLLMASLLGVGWLLRQYEPGP
jgi:hypothetical protein